MEQMLLFPWLWMCNYLIPFFFGYNPIWPSLHPQILTHRRSLFGHHGSSSYSIKDLVLAFPCSWTLSYFQMKWTFRKWYEASTHSTLLFKSNGTRKPYLENREIASHIGKLWARHFYFLVPMKLWVPGLWAQSPWAQVPSPQTPFPFSCSGLCTFLLSL